MGDRKKKAGVPKAARRQFLVTLAVPAGSTVKEVEARLRQAVEPVPTGDGVPAAVKAVPAAKKPAAARP